MASSCAILNEHAPHLHLLSVVECVAVHAPGHVKTMARDEWAHLVLMTALDRVDDTALLRKYIIAELMVGF